MVPKRIAMQTTASTKELGLEKLSDTQIEAVSGAFSLSGFEAAGVIMGIVGFGSLFTPIGVITGGIAIGSVVGLGIAQAWANWG